MRPIRPPELAIGAGALLLLGASAVGVLRGDDAGTGTEPAAGDVAIVDFAYDPSPLQTSVGQAVTWTNEDAAAHTVTSDGDGPLASGDLEEGATYEVTFDTAGTYEYLCTIHPTMRGIVEVSS